MEEEKEMRFLKNFAKSGENFLIVQWQKNENKMQRVTMCIDLNENVKVLVDLSSFLRLCFFC